MEKEIIEQTEKFVRGKLGSDSTGHDWYHIDRVRKNALLISEKEKAGNIFIIEMAALLHDIPDEKLNDSAIQGQETLNHFLQGLSVSDSAKLHITEIINSISFKGGNAAELISIEAKIVQDADRLDAIGAIGIARVFAYGGKKGQVIYDPEISVRDRMSLEEYRNGKSSSIHHFYEKLLKLKELLNTESASLMAESRQRMMENFLEQFYMEWDGKI